MIAVPDGERQLSDGLLVEASVVARLFRMRLLEVDARLIVTPARVDGERRPRAIGARLADAERCLSEGAVSLARSRTR